MKLRLGKWEKLILANVVLHVERLSVPPPFWRPGEDRLQSAIAWRLCKNAQRGIVPVDVRRWLGRTPTPSDQTQSSRAIRTLMERGLVIGHADVNVKEISLTEAGKAAAAKLLDQAPKEPA